MYKQTDPFRIEAETGFHSGLNFKVQRMFQSMTER